MSMTAQTLAGCLLSGWPWFPQGRQRRPVSRRKRQPAFVVSETGQPWRLGSGDKLGLAARSNGEGFSTQGKPVRHCHRRVIEHFPGASSSGQAYVEDSGSSIGGTRGAVEEPTGEELMEGLVHITALKNIKVQLEQSEKRVEWLEQDFEALWRSFETLWRSFHRELCSDDWPHEGRCDWEWPAVLTLSLNRSATGASGKPR